MPPYTPSASISLTCSLSKSGKFTGKFCGALCPDAGLLTLTILPFVYPSPEYRSYYEITFRNYKQVPTDFTH